MRVTVSTNQHRFHTDLLGAFIVIRHRIAHKNSVLRLHVQLGKRIAEYFFARFGFLASITSHCHVKDVLKSKFLKNLLNFLLQRVGYDSKLHFSQFQLP